MVLATSSGKVDPNLRLSRADPIGSSLMNIHEVQSASSCEPYTRIQGLCKQLESQCMAMS